MPFTAAELYDAGYQGTCSRRAGSWLVGVGALPYVGVVYGTETVYCTQAWVRLFYFDLHRLVARESSLIPLVKTRFEEVPAILHI